MLSVVKQRINFIICLVFVLLPVTVLAQSGIVLENDFEKGTHKWERRGTASISSSKDAAASGTKSLKISGRSAFWQGGQLNLTNLLIAGKTYKFTVSAKLAKGEKSDEIKLTMQRGDNDFTGIASVTFNADEWTTMSGQFKPSGQDSYLLVFVEAARANSSFFIDDFKIELLDDVIPPQAGTILLNDFEDMTAQNWGVRGDNVQMFSSNAAGSQGLKVSGRTQPWHGLALDVSPLLFKGRTYQITVSARLVKGQPGDSLKVTILQTPLKGEVKYVDVTTPTTVTDAAWVMLAGSYTATTTGNNLLLYVGAAGATTSFYIDNFSIKAP